MNCRGYKGYAGSRDGGGGLCGWEDVRGGK